jgi:predicted alpha/beta superfamily hydrolase
MKLMSTVRLCILLMVFNNHVLYTQNVKEPPRVEIPGSILQKVTSAVVGQEYNLYIQLPRNYMDSTKKFPVLYLFDAQWDFSLLTSLYGEQYYDGFIPGVIIVGITWGGVNPNHDSLRARDLTPTNLSFLPQSGGALKFLSFIKHELIPFIDSNYKTVQNDRTLIGSSFGGLFTLYALFNETDLFRRYILTSPAIGWDNEVISSFEKKYAERNPKYPVKLFMAHGGLEGGVSRFENFADHLKARKYDGFEIQTKIIEHSGHSGTKAEGYTRGLQFVFAKPSLNVSSKILDQYVGTYQITSEIKIKIEKKGGHLVALTPDGEKIELFAETEEDFYANGQYLFAHIQKKGDGTIEGFTLEQYSGTTQLKKNN